MERAEIMSQILAILEDVAEIAPEDVNENSVLMDDLDLFVDGDPDHRGRPGRDLSACASRKRNCATLSPSVTWPIIW